MAYFGRNTPPFAEITGKVDYFSGTLGIHKDVGERTEVLVRAAYFLVTVHHMLYVTVYKVGNPQRSTLAPYVHVTVYVPYRKRGHKIAVQRRGHDLHAFVNKPVDHILVAERIVFDIYFAHEAY